MDKINQILEYEMLKKLYPRNTILDGDINTFIDEVDPTFRKRYSYFFECRDPLIDTKSVDGILDWLRGCLANPFGNLSKNELHIISKVIHNIEKHIITN